MINESQIRRAQTAISDMCSDEIVPVCNLVEAPRPFFHFVCAANLIKCVAGVAPDTFLSGLKPVQRRDGKLHGLLYNAMLEKTSDVTILQLQTRIVDSGLEWILFKANLDRMPSCIPQGHRITYMKYIYIYTKWSARFCASAFHA